MFHSWRLGSALGIPLFLHPTFLLVPLYALYVSRDDGPAGILLTQLLVFSVFVCVLLHELGHALMARFFGIATRDITLYPIGGVARLESTGARPVEEVAIALAGPAVNLVIAALLALPVGLSFAAGVIGQGDPRLAAATPPGFLALYVTLLLFVNVVLMLFNLIPAFPMDGGRVLRAVLSLMMPRLKATRIAASLGLFLALGLAVTALFYAHLSLLIVSLFVAFAGQMELFVLRQREARRAAEAAEASRGFTGLAWDPEHGVWVRWLDGVPQGRQ